jgi:hypothetical protein
MELRYFLPQSKLEPEWKLEATHWQGQEGHLRGDRQGYGDDQRIPPENLIRRDVAAYFPYLFRLSSGSFPVCFHSQAH